MDNIIDYFMEEIQMNKEQKQSIEAEIKSKKIVIDEIEKAIEKLSDTENNTFHIFSANGNQSAFQNKEVLHLKKQEESIQNTIDSLEQKLELVQNKILQLTVLYTQSKDIKDALEQQKETEQAKLEKIEKETIDKDKLVEELRNISSKIDFATKLFRTDYERCKMELGLARIKLLFCIEEISGEADDNVSRETLSN